LKSVEDPAQSGTKASGNRLSRPIVLQIGYVARAEDLNPFSWPVRVYYEDTDAGGVVFYANYLKYMERARTEWLRALGFEQQRVRNELGRLFVVSDVSLQYRLGARLDDLLDVTVTLAGRGGASLDFAQRVIRRGDAALCCSAQVKVACVAADSLRPKPLPDPLLAEIADVL
jgi:acyl-CoA thioester hydrolase